MKKSYNTSYGYHVDIDLSKLIGGKRGGEGAVYDIVYPSFFTGSHCVKIYHEHLLEKEEDRQKKYKKIKFQIQNPPQNIETAIYKICWPVVEIFEGQNFVGFVMTKAFSDSKPLYGFTIPKFPKSYGSIFRNKFEFRQESGMLARYKLCYNVSHVLSILNKHKKYVVADFKPDNILVSTNGAVSLIDCDSIQISEGSRVLFHAPVTTPGYAPPESENLTPSEDRIEAVWDSFSLAVIIYQILFCIHPYAASFRKPYEKLENLSSNIKAGLFVHGSKKTYILKKPPFHDPFEGLSDDLKSLFFKAFEEGHDAPEKRPSPSEWKSLLYDNIKSNKVVIIPKVPVSSARISPVRKIVKPQVVSTQSDRLQPIEIVLLIISLIFAHTIFAMIVN